MSVVESIQVDSNFTLDKFAIPFGEGWGEGRLALNINVTSMRLGFRWLCGGGRGCWLLWHCVGLWFLGVS